MAVTTDEELTEKEIRKIIYLKKMLPLVCKDCKKVIREEILAIVFD